MSGMRRADRRDSNYDNSLNHLRSRKEEPTSREELKQLLTNARSQRDEAKSERDKVKSEREEIEKYLQETKGQLVHIQQDFQTSQTKFHEWKELATENHQLYLDEQQNYHQTLSLYNQEKARAIELLAKYEEADSQRLHYLTLCNEAQTELKYERRSKAGIKGWETRRKRENERLKQEIAEMVVLLRESLASKDEAVNNLYVVAERMDRIQQLVDSVEDISTNTSVGLVQKFKRIWLTIKDILAE
jgi:hypothetical protein